MLSVRMDLLLMSRQGRRVDCKLHTRSTRRPELGLRWPLRKMDRAGEAGLGRSVVRIVA